MFPRQLEIEGNLFRWLLRPELFVGLLTVVEPRVVYLASADAVVLGRQQLVSALAGLVV